MDDAADLLALLVGQVERLEGAHGHLLGCPRLDREQEAPQRLALEGADEDVAGAGVAQDVGEDRLFDRRGSGAPGSSARRRGAPVPAPGPGRRQKRPSGRTRIAAAAASLATTSTAALIGSRSCRAPAKISSWRASIGSLGASSRMPSPTNTYSRAMAAAAVERHRLRRIDPPGAQRERAGPDLSTIPAATTASPSLTPAR